MSALSAYELSVKHSCSSRQQVAESCEQPADTESALAELSKLRSEMAALQAALTVLKGTQNSLAARACLHSLSCRFCLCHHDAAVPSPFTSAK